MRAMQLVDLNQPLQMHDIPRPAAGPGEVLLRVLSCGVNFADTLMVKGQYQETPALPATLGMEVCGIVEGLGAGVSDLAPGMRVAAYSGGGGFADYLNVPASRCVPVPEDISSDDAAGFLIAYGTSHVALCTRAGMTASDTVLVLGASSGVGMTAIDVAKAVGARVIGVARGVEKCAAIAKAGADHVFDVSDNIRAEVKALGGADILYDPVGGDQFDAGLRACKPLARIIPIGFASGNVPQIPANILLVKNLTVHGVYWGAYAHLEPRVLTDSFRQLFDWFAAGKLHPQVDHVIPLDKANDALDLLRNRKAIGKVVVRVAES